MDRCGKVLGRRGNIMKKEQIKNKAVKIKRTGLNALVNLIFSRIMMVVILMLLQIALLLWVFTIMGEYSQWVLYSLNILAAVLVVVIINSNDNPAFKLAWMVPLCVVPVFGAVLYLLVRINPASVGIKKGLHKNIDKTKEYLTPNEDVVQRMWKENVPITDLAYYIQNVNGFPSYDKTKATYFPDGEAKLADLIPELKKAEKFIFLEYFIINPGRVWEEILAVLEEKAAEGVEVRLMYDGFNSILKLPRKYPEKLREKGIKVKVFGYWKDTAVKLSGDAVKSFTAMFLQMWNISDTKEEDYGKYLNADCGADKSGKNGFVIPYNDDPCNGEDVAEEVYIDILNKARSYVYIMTPYLIPENEIITALKFAAQRGIDVRIIMPHIPDKKVAFSVAHTYYPKLLEAGVKIYEFTPGFVHAKMFLSDDIKAVVGTINLDFRSLYEHYECATFIYDNPVIGDIKEDFRRTFEKCERFTEGDYKKLPLLHRMCGRICRLFAPLM